MMTYTITPNEAFKSLEIAFNGKPSEAVRDALKSLRYRWHSVKKVWYGYSDEETVKTAIDNAENGVKVVKAEKPVKATEKANKMGVKVGDVFHMSWGYEQTNADFFQVVALCGENSVRVVEVYPEIIKTAPTCSMAEDRTYKIESKPMRRAERSTFIKDNTKGDIKRVTDYGNGIPCIKVRDYHATKVSEGEYTTYVSWYY